MWSAFSWASADATLIDGIEVIERPERISVVGVSQSPELIMYCEDRTLTLSRISEKLRFNEFVSLTPKEAFPQNRAPSKSPTVPR